MTVSNMSINVRGRISLCARASALILTLFWCFPSFADDKVQFDIPGTTLKEALLTLGRQANLTIVLSLDVEVSGHAVDQVVGSYAPLEVLDVLLSDSKLTYRQVAEDAFVIERVHGPIEAAGLTARTDSGDTTLNTGKPAPSVLHRLVTALAGILISNGAVAADNNDDQKGKEKRIEEIVVTATYHETNLMQTPMAISALINEEIIERGISDISDLYTFIPGLSYQSRDGGENAISIRGVTPPTLLGGAMVAVYVDDMPIPSPPLGRFGTGSFNGQISGNVFDLERIEVLKGPQGTLYGENAMGGAIRYITKKADPNEFDGGIMTRLSNSSESDDLSHRVVGLVNIPLIKDVLGLRLSGDLRDDAGQIDVVGNRVANDVDSDEVTGLRAKLTWYATDGLDVTLIANRIDKDIKGPRVAHYAIGTDRTNSPDVNNAGWDTQDLYTLAIRYDLPWATFTSGTSRFERTYDYTSQTPSTFIPERFIGQLAIPVLPDGEGGFVANPIYDPTFPATPPRLSAAAYNARGLAYENFSQEFRLISTSDGPLSWVAGLYYKDFDGSTGNDDKPTYVLHPVPGLESYLEQMLALFPGNEVGETAEELSGYGNVNYRFNEQWEIGLGLRQSSVQTSRENDPLEIDEDISSVRFTLDYQPNDSTMVYFTTSSGYRPGLSNGTNDWLGAIPNLQSLGTPQALAEADYISSNLSADGDKVTNYEVGLKALRMNDRIRLIASVYYIDWNDILLAINYSHSLRAFPVNYSINGGAAHSQGIELSFSAEVFDGLTLSAVGDYNDEAQLDEGTNDGNSTTNFDAGTRLPNSPKYSYNVSADYQFELGQFPAGVRADWARVPSSRYHLCCSHITAGYHRTNLRFTLRDQEGRWRAALFADNLFDEIIVYSNNPWGMRFGPSRQVGVEFSYSPGRR